jgi:hypothetical protein
MYVVYRLHEFFSKKDTTPIGDTVLVMFVVHSFQFITIGLYLSFYLNFTWGYISKSPSFYLTCALISIGYYFIVFHNGEWKEWAKKFKKETPEERKRNGIKVWLFCWGSIIFFFLSLGIISFLK